jgi:hypothetical protein
LPRTKDSVRELIMRRLLDYEYSYPPTAYLVITSEAGKKGFGTMERAGLSAFGEPFPKTSPD